MSPLGEPDNEVYRLTKSGTRALLEAVDTADTKASAAKASQDQPCDAVSAYLDTSFLGLFLRSGRLIPYAENAGELGTYIDYLESSLASGSPQATPLHKTHLKLLAYVAAIEAEAPLVLFGNGLEFLRGVRKDFDFGIHYNQSSANNKLNAVGLALARAPVVPAAFQALYRRLRQLIDRDLRNAIAHATYRVHSDQQRVDIWSKGELIASRTLKEVHDAQRDARSFQQGFIAAVSEFADAIHPDCPYVWRP